MITLTECYRINGESLMNTDTTDNGETGAGGLKGSFGDRGTNVNSLSYGHPYGEKIIEEIKEVLRESETGRKLISVHTHHNIPVQVIKGVGASGFNPQAKIIYLQISGKVKKASPTMVLQVIKGLREADQEMLGFTAPDPAKDIMEYATVMHSKALDAIIYICKVVKELTNSSYYSVLLDEIDKLGHIKVYKAYERDASKEELFKAYADIEERV